MPSLVRKLSSRRRRRSSVKKQEEKEQQQQRHSWSPKDKVPVSSIEIEEPEDVVSPLRSPNLNKAASVPSLAFTDSMSHSWSEESTRKASSSDEESNVVEASDKIIPPRPERSHWLEEDFLKVINVWELSQDEIYKMRELEAKLFDVTHWKNNPFEVVRFMKGPQGYKPAERLFRRMIDWRIKENVDTILQDYTPPPVLLDYCPSAILYGLDKDGDPIYLERAGATDASGLLKRFGHAALIKHVVWLRELCGRGAWIKDHEERMGRPITQVTIVYDLAGLNPRHLRPGVLPFFGAMMRLTQDYYTGPVKRMVIIRAPAIFRVAWSIVKNFFDPWAVAKMTFTGSHNHEEILSNFMDLEVLPEVICPEHGRGVAAEGMPQRFEGGIPPSFDNKEQISSKVEPKILPTVASTASTIDDNSSCDDENKRRNNNKRVSVSTLGSGFFNLDDDTGGVDVHAL